MQIAPINIQETFPSFDTAMVSNNFETIFKEATRELTGYSRGNILRPQHLLAALISSGGGFSRAIVQDHVDELYLFDVRKELIEDDQWNNHLSQNASPDEIELWGKILDAVNSKIDRQIWCSNEIYLVVERAKEITTNLQRDNIGTGELLAAVLDVCKNDPKLKSFIYVTQLTSEKVIAKLREVYSNRQFHTTRD